MNHRLDRRYRRASFALAAVSLLAAAGPAASGTDAPVLIELFTAEGCSSCPPADNFLGTLDSAQPVQGAHLIVLSEHVDYWDGRGWPDPYSSKAFTDRQVAYERRLKMNEPFTPQFVVDGAVDMSLSHKERIKDQLLKAAAAPKIPVTIESLGIAAAPSPAISGVVNVAMPADEHACDLFIAVALDHAESQVLRGENRGQHLTHVAVLRELVRVGPVAPGGSATQPFSVPLPKGAEGAALRVVAFVQQPGNGAVRGAAEKATGP